MKNPIGDRIRKLRGRIPQSKLAAAAGIDVGTLNRIERGRQPTPSHPTLAAIARALNVDVNVLYGESGKTAHLNAVGGEESFVPPPLLEPGGDPRTAVYLSAKLQLEISAVWKALWDFRDKQEKATAEIQERTATLEARFDAAEQRPPQRDRRTLGRKGAASA